MGQKSPPKPPPPPAPTPIPESPIDATEQTAKRIRRRKGYASQIVTGNLGPQSGGKDILG